MSTMPTPNGQERKLTAHERATLFSQATRQNFQMMPTKRASGEQQTLQFTLPKVRLLSRILLQVEATAVLTSTAGVIATDRFTPYKVLRRVSLDLNNGFSPFIVSGAELYLYNHVHSNPYILDNQGDPKGNTYVENVASAGGTRNKIKFTLALPLTLNERDPVGLVLLQNEETNVTLTVDVDRLANAYTLNDANGDAVTFEDLSVTPMVETFSIPPIPEAFPDISVLKIVQSKGETFSGNGQNIVKLGVGTIYRKLVLYFENEDGTPLDDDDFTGNLELVFNQADIPYSIKPSVLSSLNHWQFGDIPPQGVYIFDFSYQGISNLGGSRDYIDTERLTEFWLRFSTQTRGKVTAISETLSRLRQ